MINLFIATTSSISRRGVITFVQSKQQKDFRETSISLPSIIIVSV